MTVLWTRLFVFAVLVAVVIHVYNRSVLNLTELETCPFCYGEDYCSELKNVSLQYRTFKDFMFNLLSSKNVYFAKNANLSLVIKKLADSDDFVKLNRDVFSQSYRIINIENVLKLLNKQYRNLQICDVNTSKLFLQKFAHKNLTNLWTLLNVNAEPLTLELFRQEDNWPVPKLFGYCGRTAIVENCGIPLNDIEDFDWYSRVYVALQLLEAAEQFTFGHNDFRLYLTDISPDNVVVDLRTLKISFVDLEHAILQNKVADTPYHYTEHMNSEDYSFSTEGICNSYVSDHNIYAVCKLLLSPSAPWPMMHSGLLHSPPPTLDTSELFDHIELCVYSQNKIPRYLQSLKIKESLSDILDRADYFL